ncbi:DUF4838 domain-containing protein [bacterium]|nr:DUF4838 domain-containing protein [bacterium]
MQPTIVRFDTSQPAKLAARELRRCLSQMTGQEWSVRSARAYDPKAPGLWLGSRRSAGFQPAPEADEVTIEATAKRGLIAGSNPRSILLAAYRYLTELGCRWVRPGKTGESLPTLRALPPVRLQETASYRHRGVCIEGAVSWEHVRDMVDWLPKLGFNGYFIQFREAYNFFQRWYEHEANPLWPRAQFTTEQAAELTTRLRREIKRRGLDLHLVGHGWTCEPFGIPGPGWFEHKGPIPADAVQYLAEIRGERKLWGNIALNTNLCYGNPETRRIVTDAIVEYAGANPDVDIIHFWLADGSNNQCECPLCRDHRPADLYVKMLNELDDKLTAAGSPVRIVFLAYVDLLWPPLKERLKNQDRFILMFAPITRSYSTSFTEAGVSAAKLPPYKRNQLKFPADPAINLAFLKGWQDQFRGEGFDFDYHFMWDHYKDPGQTALAHVLHRDVQGLRAIGLDGFMSCQVQRLFFPTGLGMTVLGRTLWNRKLSFGEIARDHMAACFGADGELVLKYLKQLSKLFAPRVLRGEAKPEEALKDWQAIPSAVDRMAPIIARNLGAPDACQAHSWRLLADFGELCVLQSEALVAKHTGSPDWVEAAREVIAWARTNEKRLQHVFDVFEFVLTFGGILGLCREELLALGKPPEA